MLFFVSHIFFYRFQHHVISCIYNGFKLNERVRTRSHYKFLGAFSFNYGMVRCWPFWSNWISNWYYCKKNAFNWHAIENHSSISNFISLQIDSKTRVKQSKWNETTFHHLLAFTHRPIVQSHERIFKSQLSWTAFNSKRPSENIQMKS